MRFFCNFCAQRASACAPCVRVCRQAFLCLDGSCGMPVETVDASLGIMGIMGNSWGRHEIPRGFARAQWRGVDSITPAASPRVIKQPVQVQYLTPTRVPPAVKRGSGGEHCGGTTQLSPPDAASRGKVFCKSFRRKAGRFAKIL